MIQQYSDIHLEKNIIATIPATKLGKYDVVFVWGGLEYAYPSWMLKQLPDELFYANILFFIPYNIKWKDVQPIYKNFLTDRHLINSISKKSIIGFSEGAMEVYRNYTKRLKFVGLIDPISKNTYTKISFNQNTHLIYNPSNWQSSPITEKSLPNLAQHIQDNNGTVECVEMNHKNIPSYFFSKFIGKLA
tara:strand:- start:2251 stop:2817 length:567 start_codon:yes stop_codon:yes gene_type:complete